MQEQLVTVNCGNEFNSHEVNATQTTQSKVEVFLFLHVIYGFAPLQQWMENQDCEEASIYPCCSQSTFPYKQDVFELCIKRAIMELDRSTSYHLVSKTPGPRFDINDTIRAIVLEFQSTYLFTLAYEKMYQFYREVKYSLNTLPAV